MANLLELFFMVIFVVFWFYGFEFLLGLLSAISGIWMMVRALAALASDEDPNQCKENTWDLDGLTSFSTLCRKIFKLHFADFIMLNLFYFQEFTLWPAKLSREKLTAKNSFLIEDSTNLQIVSKANFIILN